MGLLGTAFGRGLAGAGQAAAAIGQQYVSEEIEMNKMRLLEDLRYQGAVRLDQYQQGPERQRQIAENDAARERTVGTARNQVALEGARAVATDEPLNTANVKNVSARATAEESARTVALIDRAKALLPMDVKRAVQIANATRGPGPQTLSDKLGEIEKALGRPLNEQERLGALGLLPKVDQKLGMEEVERTVETVDKDGNTTTEKTKGYRPVGAAQPQTDPAAQVRAAVTKARADGKVADLVAEFKARGATPQQMISAGLTQQELSAARGNPKQDVTPLLERAMRESRARGQGTDLGYSFGAR